MVVKFRSRLFNNGWYGIYHLGALARYEEKETMTKSLLTTEELWPLIREGYIQIDDFPLFDASLILEPERGWLNVKLDSPHKKIPVMRRINLTKSQVDEMFGRLDEVLYLPKHLMRLEITLKADQIPFVKMIVHPVRKRKK
jgi:hypothetical protein